MKVLNIGEGPIPEFENANVTKYKGKFPRGKFDVIYSFDDLNQYSYYEIVKRLREYKEHIKPNGEVWILIPSFEWAARLYLKGMVTLPILDILSTTGITINLLRNTMEELGFIIRKAHQTIFAREYDDKVYKLTYNEVIGLLPKGE